MILLVGFSGHFSFPVSRTSEHLEHFTITELQDVNIAYICIPFVLFRQLSSIGPIDFFFEQNKPDALSRPDPLFLLVFTCSYLFLFLKENSIATSESRKSAQLTNHAFVFIVYANIIYIYIHGYKYTNVYNLPSQGVHWTNQPR